MPLFGFFFFNDTATTEIYTLSLHDALPIYRGREGAAGDAHDLACERRLLAARGRGAPQQRQGHRGSKGDEARSEEHTSEIQSRPYLVCRLLLLKKKIDSCSELRSIMVVT